MQTILIVMLTKNSLSMAMTNTVLDSIGDINRDTKSLILLVARLKCNQIAQNNVSC